MLNWLDDQDTSSDELVGVNLPLAIFYLSDLFFPPTFYNYSLYDMAHTYLPDMMYYLLSSSDMIPLLST